MKHILKQSGYKPEVVAHQQDYLFFGGTSYLGLNYNQQYLKIFSAGLIKWGLNNGASRNNNISLSIYEEGESLLASNYNLEAAITFSSGWLAATTAVQMLQTNREIIYVNDAHPALMATIPQQIIDIRIAVEKINMSLQTQFLLVGNSVNNIHPRIFDFTALQKIKPDKEVILLLDHSHGFGYLEKKWLVQFENLPKNIRLILCGSLAKGLSLDAGVIIGDKKLIDLIKQSQAFNGASPCSPAVLHTYLHGQEIIAAAQGKLQKNLNYFFSKCSTTNYYWIKDFPVVLIKNEEKALQLQKQQIIFTSFPYPLANSPVLNRLVISANHILAQIDKVL
ncbi:aminotransferase class I/II-fold pyridoxal phosphate-dependent enzyme [Pedobacter alpinus]|uniref:Aminotransferase class I/II-fold pyridoxal phosphate-dependent enzyme n=1 Tax=Pedobacter alpinus TaxID=1590643 RepID=A0ABW5TPS8_9SPHI